MKVTIQKKTLTFNSTKVSVAYDGGGEGEGGDPECGRRLTGCLGAAFAGAIVTHAGCVATDWVTLGISAYWCHGGVILLQAAVSDGCNLDFKECNSKKTKDNVE